MHQICCNPISKFVFRISVLITIVFCFLFFFKTNIDTAEIKNIENESITAEYQAESLEIKNYANLDLKIGDKIIVDSSNDEFFIEDIYRLNNLKLVIFLFLLFVIILLRKQGFQVLASIFVSIGVISFITLPMILSGFSPVFTCILSSLLLIPSTFYLTHGVSRKTNLAVLSTLFTLIVSSIVIILTTKFVNLSGMSSEEANFLMFNGDLQLDYAGILFGGVLISLLGVLDDVTMTQTSMVLELKDQNKKNIWTRAMNVGKDHIASLTNTIFLIYAGASLPLLLLFSLNSESLSLILNVEPVVEEIVRSVIATFSLVLAVPISTWIACNFNKNE